MMPSPDGIEICKTLRGRGDATPILLLTARREVSDRVAGLDAGADDYLVNPFAYDELAARLRALIRRAATHLARPDGRLARGPSRLEEGRRQVTVDGTPVELSPREFSLLECLLRHPGQVLTRDQLLDHAWPTSVAVTPNAVDTYVHSSGRSSGRAPRHES
jgi:DNA-binding response OmpR family regulator